VTTKVENSDPLFTVAEAAAYLNQTERWVRRAVENRTIEHLHLVRGLRFRKSALDAYIESQIVPAKSK
jgi:excisionase family DNA binding protein